MQLMAISEQLYIRLYITAHLHPRHNRPQPVVYCCYQFPCISNTLQNMAFLLVCTHKAYLWILLYSE